MALRPGCDSHDKFVQSLLVAAALCVSQSGLQMKKMWFIVAAIDGDHYLHSRTLCMSGKNYNSTQYNMHSLFGYFEAKATMRWVSIVC